MSVKQIALFDLPENVENKILGKYTTKIKPPIYEPRYRKPFVEELYNREKTAKLIRSIKASNVSEGEKKFLIEAAQRHTVFDFRRIADYYAHSNPEMQRLMEESALVIIDFCQAIEGGFVRLTDEIAEQYIDEDDGDA